MRLPNGYGSVYKLSGNRRRPWIARVTTGWDDNGKQQYYTIGYYKNSPDALAALANYHKKLLSPKSDMTLGEVYEEWSASKFKKISKSTIDTYKASWKYMQKYENERFREIRTAQWQKIIDDNSNMSLSTLTKIKALGTSLYDYATANDIVDKNYMQFVELPKKEKEEKKTFTDLEIKTMFDNVDKVPWVDTILIMIYTGMRISEMLGLTKFDVDLENKMIIGGIKSEAGKNRIIPIHDKIYNIIVDKYNSPGEYLITYEDGSNVSVDHYRRKKYYPALKAIGVRQLTPHACRHTFATRMDKAGADKVAIQKIIGHSDYAFTANTYTHTDAEELRKELNKII
jgi:integrase